MATNRTSRGGMSTGMIAALAVIALLLIGGMLMYAGSDRTETAGKDTPAATTGAGGSSDPTGAGAAPKSKASDPTGANRSTPPAPKQ